MYRSHRTLSALAAAACLALLAGALPAAEFEVEGKYEVISPPQPTTTPGKVEVVDVFWFGCPHCYRFLPVMEAYAASKPDYVEVVRMPAIFRKSWEAHARAFYTARVLGVEDELHQAIFEAIHVGRAQLDTKEDLAAFFERHGVSREAFDKTFSSFAVESGVRRSMVMQGRYGIRGTPTVVVNGKYRVSGTLAGSYENMVKVIEILADKEHKVLTAAR